MARLPSPKTSVARPKGSNRRPARPSPLDGHALAAKRAHEAFGMAHPGMPTAAWVEAARAALGADEHLAPPPGHAFASRVTGAIEAWQRAYAESPGWPQALRSDRAWRAFAAHVRGQP